MRGNLRIVHDDGRTVDVHLRTGDLVKFERAYDLSADVLNGDTVRIEHVLFIAYTAAKRDGSTDLEFDEWIDTVETIEDDGNEPVPLESTPA